MNLTELVEALDLDPSYFSVTYLDLPVVGWFLTHDWYGFVGHPKVLVQDGNNVLEHWFSEPNVGPEGLIQRLMSRCPDLPLLETHDLDPTCSVQTQFEFWFGHPVRRSPA